MDSTEAFHTLSKKLSASGQKQNSDSHTLIQALSCKETVGELVANPLQPRIRYGVIRGKVDGIILSRP